MRISEQTVRKIALLATDANEQRTINEDGLEFSDVSSHQPEEKIQDYDAMLTSVINNLSDEEKYELLAIYFTGNPGNPENSFLKNMKYIHEQDISDISEYLLGINHLGESLERGLGIALLETKKS
jgi:hypothetical protein